MSIDTENILAELSDKIGRLQTLEWELVKRARQRAAKLSAARDNYLWIRKVIQAADSGRKWDWLEEIFDDLQSPDYQADQLEGVPAHIIEHAISLTKQAIANNAPSLV